MKKNTKKTRRSKRARPGGSISNPNEAPILGPAAERSPKGKEKKSPRGDCSNNRFNFADGLWKALRRDAHYAGNEIITHRALHTCIWIFGCFLPRRRLREWIRGGASRSPALDAPAVSPPTSSRGVVPTACSRHSWHSPGRVRSFA